MELLACTTEKWSEGVMCHSHQSLTYNSHIFPVRLNDWVPDNEYPVLSLFVETVTPLVTVSTVPPVIANPDLLVRFVTVSEN